MAASTFHARTMRLCRATNQPANALNTDRPHFGLLCRLFPQCPHNCNITVTSITFFIFRQGELTLNFLLFGGIRHAEDRAALYGSHDVDGLERGLDGRLGARYVLRLVGV